MTQQKTTFNLEAYTWLLVRFASCNIMQMAVDGYKPLSYSFNALNTPQCIFPFWFLVNFAFDQVRSSSRHHCKFIHLSCLVQAQRRSREQSRSASALSLSAGDEKSEHSEAADQHMSYYSNGGFFTTTTSGTSDSRLHSSCRDTFSGCVYCYFKAVGEGGKVQSLAF